MVDGIQEEIGSAETEESTFEDDFRAEFDAAIDSDDDEAGEATATSTGAPDGDTGENDIQSESEQEWSDDGDVDDGAEEASDGTPDFAPPQHWSAENRAQFDELPVESKGVVVDLYKGMEAAHTRRSMELADKRRDFAPFEEAIAGTGIPLAQAVEELAGIHRAMQSDPEAELKRLATKHGIRLEAPRRSNRDLEDEYDDDDEFIDRDPELEAMRNELSEAKREIADVKLGQTRTAQAETAARVSEFVSSKDAKGNLLHPHFEAVQSEMVNQANADRMSGKSSTLETLYERALWLVPEVREKVLEERESTASITDKKLKQEKLKRARRAGLGARGTSKSPPQRDSVPESFEDHFMQELRSASAS
jgi:hypothetical protein